MINPGPFIHINGIDYFVHELPEKLGAFGSFEHSVLSFCASWLDGQTHFEITTSGSTGKPRPIKISREQIKLSVQQTALALDLRSGMTALVCLDIRYIAGMMMLVRGLELKMNMIVVPPSANPFESVDSNVKIDFVALVPFQLTEILSSSHRSRFQQINCSIIGGAALNRTISTQLEEFPCRFYETYGMTETVSHVALKRLNGRDRSDLFQVLPNIRISQDSRGCLVIESPIVEGGRVITNDIVALVNREQFRWLGRADNVINSGAIKIYPEELELSLQAILDELNVNNRYFITGLPDETLGQKAVLILEGTIQNPEGILSKCKANLRHKSPREIICISEFTETDTGKINRKETLNKIPSRAPHG